MKLTAVFEHWHLGDGNYPALAVGDEVRLSFELTIHSLAPLPPDAAEEIVQIQDAEYAIAGRVIRRYTESAGREFPVFEADWFRFYCPIAPPDDLPIGARVRLRGALALDHYLWVEFLPRYPDPPDLFYNLRVARVRQVRIPTRFVTRTQKSLSHPTSVAPAIYDGTDVVDVSRVAEPDDGAACPLAHADPSPYGAGHHVPDFTAACRPT